MRRLCRLINPTLNAKIDWGWFIASQVAFGLITGYVVAHSKWVETQQAWPLAARAGMEAPGLMPRRRSDDAEPANDDCRCRLPMPASPLYLDSIGRRSAIQDSLAGIIALFLLRGCNIRLPGQPTEAERWRAPSEISDFSQLYTQNCAGCHGADGQLGAARSLNDSLYLSFVTDDALKQVISQAELARTCRPSLSGLEAVSLISRLSCSSPECEPRGPDQTTLRGRASRLQRQ